MENLVGLGLFFAGIGILSAGTGILLWGVSQLEKEESKQTDGEH